MRIRTLRFGNLNSLAGIWEIDFTHPDYVSSGIFAITGPTGAGKSTILDAICLSLYGQTPRLGRITQTANEIMSRRTGACFSEVEFETGRGRFRCHWSQHRSRKRPDGQLQAPKHEIAAGESCEILESRLSAVAKKVEEVTGMDFQRFTQSMLLAQGGFAAFLQARPDERAPILEQITGTEIYSRISMKVHDLTSEQRRKLEALRLGLEGMQLLSIEEELLLKNDLAEKERLEIGLGESIRQLQLQKEWRERITALEAELARLEESWQAFLARKKDTAPELEQLERGTLALSLDGEHARVEAVRGQQRAEQAELSGAIERLPSIQRSCREVAEALNKAESNLQNALAEQTGEMELIRATRELDMKSKSVSSRIQELESETTKLAQQDKAYRDAVTHCDLQLNEANVTLQAAVLFLAEHAADAGLMGELTGIEQQIKTLRSMEKQFTERQEQTKKQILACAEAEQTLRKAGTDREKALRAVLENEQRLGATDNEIRILLRGRELPEWRNEVDAHAVKLGALQDLSRILATIGEAAGKLAALQQRREALEHDRTELQRQENSLTAQYRLGDDMVQQLQDKIVLLNRVRDLEAERTRLVEGLPCPLCGATMHPYADGNIPCPDEAERELEQARQLTRETGDRLTSVKTGLAGLTKELEQIKRDDGELMESMHCAETAFSAGCAGLEASIDPERRLTDIQAMIESRRQVLAELGALIQEVDLRHEKRLKLKAEHDRARELFAGLDKLHQAAVLGRDSAANELKRLERECEAMSEDLDHSLTGIKLTLEPYGHDNFTLTEAETALTDLTDRRNQYAAKAGEQELLEKQLAILAGEKQKQQALLSGTERNLAERETQLRERLAQRDELATRRRELFGDRDPDSEEQRLTRMMGLAVDRRDEVRQEYSRLQSELAALGEQIDRRTASVTTRAAELARQETLLQRLITGTGFEDEGAYLQARLTGERLEALNRLADDLRREETELLARRADRAAVARLEKEKNLTGKPLELILEESATLNLQLGELRKELGALGHRLLQHEENRELRKNRLQAMERQKNECDRWECLHALIGSSDGKKFRNFAQGLTFELMVAHANVQLRKMNDRYILMRDRDEPLELNVMDNYQAGEIRSTKNLSGGESFIVSLALALGLSGMASRNMRIDSLFLDEGFGALDEDALETALETLSGLQRDGKLIGVISHVPALRERIGARIQVESGSAGRSVLDGPGCRRIA